MKVAHVLRKYDPREWGGTETAVEQLLEGLRAAGVSSVVFAPVLDGEVDPRLDVLARAGHEVRRFHAFVPAMGVSADERARLVAVGGNLMSLDLPLLLLREPGVSIVHTHALGRLGGIARTVARARNVPLVVTIHGGYHDLPDRVRRELAAPLRNTFEYGKAFGLVFGARRVVRDADAVLTCNPREAELVSREAHAGRIVHMPHGIPMARFRDDARAAARALLGDLVDLGALGGPRILLSVGRIDAVKNQGFLVEHLPAILARHPEVVLVMVGAVTDPAHQELIAQRTSALSLGARVLHLGALPPGDPRLLGLYQLADAVVLPSVSETFGLVILEAWAAGAPVVASRTSGALELVTEGFDGRLFDIGDGAQFVESVCATLDDPERAREMARRGGEKVARDYDRDSVARRVRDLYAELVDAR